MNEEQQIIKDQLEIIPENLRSYISGKTWANAIPKIAVRFNVPADKVIDLENEIFLVLVCLESSRDFAENIKREVGLDEGTARRVADSVNGSIFGPVMKDIKGYWENIPAEQNTATTPKPEEPKIKPYDSFEQTILRQAIAMKPAVTSEGGQAKPVSPTEQLAPKIEQRDTPKKYSPGNDPYREPIE